MDIERFAFFKGVFQEYWMLFFLTVLSYTEFKKELRKKLTDIGFVCHSRVLDWTVFAVSEILDFQPANQLYNTNIVFPNAVEKSSIALFQALTIYRRLRKSTKTKQVVFRRTTASLERFFILFLHSRPINPTFTPDCDL
jgi:hypothetical protein